MRFGFLGVAALLVSFTLFVSANSPASADAIVTSEATYNSEVLFVGATATQSSVAPINFTFSISFVPTPINTSGPNFSTNASPPQRTEFCLSDIRPDTVALRYSHNSTKTRG
jgi:hypothetical protein